jgi:curved DNA-binding protein CbpA
MLPDHYQALGVPPSSDAATVRAAYLRVMRAHHPDRRPGDRDSEAIARRANAAWHVLSDEARRASYDRLRGARESPGAGGGHARVMPPPGAAARRAAYSEEQHRVRAAFHRACVRVGAAVFAVGMVLLVVAAA